MWVGMVSVVLGLWFGYYLGYHHGKQSELAAWRAAEQVELETEDGKLVAVPVSSASERRVRITTARLAERLRHGVYYADPHRKTRVSMSPRRAENVPDPRSMLVNPQEGDRLRDP